jgi:hypothetical protein
MIDIRQVDEILRKVRIERIDQNAKWGVQTHTDLVWSAILAEEVGEACKEALERATTSVHNEPKLIKELVQVAAVAVAWIEAIRSKEQPKLNSGYMRDKG